MNSPARRRLGGQPRRRLIPQVRVPPVVIPVETAAGLEPAFDIAAYYPVLIYAVVVVGMASSIVAATHVPFLKPRKATRTKQMTYESGMDPVGTARMQFDVKFYLIANLVPRL